MKILLIGLFGGLGVLSRYSVSLLMARANLFALPLGTLMVNLLGAAGIGLVYVLGVERMLMPVDLRLGIMVGFLAGFTTFSSYCLESLQLLEQQRYIAAAFYFIGSPVVGFLMVILGMWLGRRF